MSGIPQTLEEWTYSRIDEEKYLHCFRCLWITEFQKDEFNVFKQGIHIEINDIV